MALPQGLIISTSVWLRNNLNFDIVLATKKDGTWVDEITLATGPNQDLARTSSGTFEIVFTGADPSVLNNTGSSVQYTEAVIIGSQDPAQIITSLNTDQTTVNSKITPIVTLTGSPLTVQDGQSLRLTDIKFG